MNRSVLQLTPVLITLLCVTGCGSGSEQPQFSSDLKPVSGTVTVDGEKLAGIDVTFTPKSGGAGAARPAIGRTNEQGIYTLYTPPGGSGVNPEDYPGTLPGEYSVTFSRFVLPDGSPWDARNSEEGPMNVGATETMSVELTNPGTTPHTATVPADGSQSLDFDLKTAK